MIDALRADRGRNPPLLRADRARGRADRSSSSAAACSVGTTSVSSTTASATSASGCSRSTRAATAPPTIPHEEFTIEGWAADGAALLDALGLDRVFVHGTSMGGMIAIAFTALYPERTIAACADVAFAKPDVYRARSSASGGGWPSRCPGTTSPTT